MPAVSTMAPQAQSASPGMLVLRKSCQNCTRAKRRCTVRLPKCERCNARSIPCHYDLQPLARSSPQSRPPKALASTGRSRAPRQGSSGMPHTHIAGTLCWIDLANSPAFCDKVVLMPAQEGLMLQSPTLPVIQISCDPETESYMLEQLRLIPKYAASGLATPLIHPKAKLAKVAIQIDIILTDHQEKGVAYRSFRELVRTNIAYEDLEGLLAAVQSLILYLALALNDMSAANRARGEGLLPLLRKWIDLLLVSAKERMPRGLGPWRTWLLAESIRRTIVTGYIMGCAYQHIREGFCWHKLFIESLPFDSRPELWAAKSAQAWVAAAKAGVAAEVGESLISFHDFAMCWPQVSRAAMDDPLLRIILVAHFGKRRIVDDLP